MLPIKMLEFPLSRQYYGSPAKRVTLRIIPIRSLIKSNDDIFLFYRTKRGSFSHYLRKPGSIQKIQCVSGWFFYSSGKQFPLTSPKIGMAWLRDLCADNSVHSSTSTVSGELDMSIILFNLAESTSPTGWNICSLVISPAYRKGCW
jgi:hypothetical protein